jgi:hypothetical protein
MPREWTYDDLVAYVESLPHDVNPHSYEIVDGALVVTRSPTSITSSPARA